MDVGAIRYCVAQRNYAEVRDFEVSRYPLANIGALNFVIHRFLGWGVAANLRMDTQAKGLAELVRSRQVAVPAELVAHGRPAERLATLLDT